MNLYQLSTEFRDQLESLFDPETGEALPQFEELRVMIGNKATAVAAYILDCELDALKADAAIARIKKLQQAKERKAEKLRAYLAENMRISGINQIKSEAFEVRFYPGRDESVEIDDGATFPPELCTDPKPPAPSKTKIKAAILSGEPVAGARIVRKDRLVIK